MNEATPEEVVTKFIDLINQRDLVGATNSVSYTHLTLPTNREV